MGDYYENQEMEYRRNSPRGRDQNKNEGEGEMKKEIKVKLNVENPEPTEIIAESIIRISDGIKILLSGKLNESALLILIKNAIRTSGLDKSLGIRDIKRVLDAMAELKRIYIKRD